MEVKPSVRPPSGISFIRDEPADEDFFDTHTTLAAAITETIRHNPDTHVIGLLGRWGSGKSTVAKKVLAALEEPTSEYILFNYDAWLHQSDHIRRSFLESLLNSLVRQGAVEPAKWAPEIKKLNKQIEDVETLETPMLTDDARWLGLSLLFVPIGFALLGADTVANAFGENATQVGTWTLTVALALVLAPVMTLLLIYLTQRPCQRGFARKSGGAFSGHFWKVVDKEGKPRPWFEVISNEKIRKTDTRTYRTGEPTSIEFGRVFQRLLHDATNFTLEDGSKVKRRLVILIDNLDRVAEDEAVRMWATIRSFFLAERETEDRDFEPFHPTVILPIDCHAIEQLFGAGNEDEPASGLDPRAVSFMDKTFDVVFEVAEPVSSDWREFLKHQMQAVLNEHYQESHWFWTRRLFEQSRLKSGDPVTPREINKLVNRIGALFLQWLGSGIAVETMALYLIHFKQSGQSVLDFITETEIDFAREVPNWKVELAALHFGVPVDKAAQVLLEEPVRKAIRTKDEADLQKWANVPGFGETFEFVTADLPEDSKSISYFGVVTNAALLLGSLDHGNAMWATRAWDNLNRMFLTAPTPAQVGADLPMRIYRLSEHVHESDAERFSSHVEALLSVLLSADDTSTRPIGALGTAMSNAVNFTKAHELELPTFTFEGEVRDFLVALSQIAPEHLAWPQLRSAADSDQIIEALDAMLHSSDDQHFVPAAVSCLFSEAGKNVYGGEKLLGTGPLIEAANQVARSPGEGASGAPALLTLFRLIHDDAARESLNALASEGILKGEASAAYAAKKWASFGELTALAIWKGADVPPPDGASWQAIIASRPKFAEEVLGILRRRLPNTTTWRVFEVWRAALSGRILIEAMITSMIDREKYGTFDLDRALTKFERYHEAVPKPLRTKFVRQLHAMPTFARAVGKRPLDANLRLALQAVGKLDEGQKSLVQVAIDKRLRDTTADQWEKAVQSGSDLMKFVADRKSNSLLLGKSSALYEALAKLVPHLFLKLDTGARARWFGLVRQLNPKAANEIFRTLGAATLQAPARPALIVLKAGGMPFLKTGQFRKSAEAAVRALVLPQLRSGKGREWLKDNHAEVQHWIKAATRETQLELKQVLKKRASYANPDHSYDARQLAGHWNISLQET